MRELKPTPLTIPLSWIYGGVAALYHGAYDRGFQKPIDLGPPLLSVGNLVVGGTGKTPIVLALSQALLKRDLVPAILTRGYGGSRSGLLQDGRWETNEPAGPEAGDEPLFLSRSLPGVTIGVGKDRVLMGRNVLKRRPVDVFLLDDGFQHRRLVRRANVLLLDAAHPFGNGWLLPAGPLRESPKAVRRAGAILLTGGPASETAHASLGKTRAQVATTRSHLDHFETLSGDPRQEPRAPVIAVAGIARPERFLRLLKAHGLEVVGEKRFPDHHAYTQPEVRELEQQAVKAHAALVTTAKDAVRLSALTTSTADWCVASLRIDLEGGWDAFLTQLLPELSRQKEGGAREPLPEIVPGDLRKF